MPVFNAGVTKIGEGAAARSAAAAISECPGLKNTATALPEVVRIAQAQRMKLVGNGRLGMRPLDQARKPVLGVHHIRGTESVRKAVVLAKPEKMFRADCRWDDRLPIP